MVTPQNSAGVEGDSRFKGDDSMDSSNSAWSRISEQTMWPSPERKIEL